MNLMIKVKRREFVQGLVELTAAAIDRGYVEDAEDLMGCLRVLRPKLEQLDFFDGWIAIQKGDWQGATRIARGSLERNGDWPFATALLAYCQYATGDRTWAVSAERVLAQEDSNDAKQLMLLLLGRVDPADIGADESLMAALGSQPASVIESNFMRA